MIAVGQGGGGVKGLCRACKVAVAQLASAGLFEIAEQFVIKDRTEFNQMAIGVDDRMTDLAAQLCRFGCELHRGISFLEYFASFGFFEI